MKHMLANVDEDGQNGLMCWLCNAEENTRSSLAVFSNRLVP